MLDIGSDLIAENLELYVDSILPEIFSGLANAPPIAGCWKQSRRFSASWCFRWPPVRPISDVSGIFPESHPDLTYRMISGFGKDFFGSSTTFRNRSKFRKIGGTSRPRWCPTPKIFSLNYFVVIKTNVRSRYYKELKRNFDLISSLIVPFLTTDIYIHPYSCVKLLFENVYT